MESTGATGLDVITTGFTGAGRGSKLIRTVSFFGPRFADGWAVTFSSRDGGTNRVAGPDSVSIPGGFGNGCNSGDEAGEIGGVKVGRRGKILGASAVDSAEGGWTILGGTRRIDVTEGLEGSTIRAVSGFAAFGSAAACSGRGGSAMRTVSFFGSAMGGWGLRLGKSHKSRADVTRKNRARASCLCGG
jgi:hypothetical protein